MLYAYCMFNINNNRVQYYRLIGVRLAAITNLAYKLITVGPYDDNVSNLAN